MFNKVMINPTEIEYVRFGYDNRKEVYDEIAIEQTNIKASRDKYGKSCLIIPTHNGVITCHEGDYIIKDPNSTDWCKFISCNQITFKCLMKTFGVNI